MMESLFQQYKSEALYYIQHFGLTGHIDGNADAFRHAYASAAMTQDFGSVIARIGGRIVEFNGAQRDPENYNIDSMYMDVFNNKIGRSLAEGTTTRWEIANAVHNALYTGQLVTSLGSPPGYTPNDQLLDLYTRIGQTFNEMIAYQDEGGTLLVDGFSPSDYFDLNDAMKELSDSINTYLTSEDAANLPQEQKAALQDMANNLKNYATFNEAMYYDPLIIDLDGDGIETVSHDESASEFDLFDGEGAIASHGWVSSDDALLAIDKNANGHIDDIGELFGSAQTSGFEALTVHDENQDGVIDENDAVFDALLVWLDSNGDGVSQAHELLSLADVGITSISLAATEGAEINNGNLITRSSSVTYADGSQSQISDVNFGLDMTTIQSNQKSDTFAYGDLTGSHKLNHFEDGLDYISIAGVSFDDLDIMDTGFGARVEIGADFSLNIKNVSSEQLTEDDFLFV